MRVYPSGSIELSDDNYINISGKDFELRPLTESDISGKGGNSNVFLLYDLQEDTCDLVIKICKINLWYQNKSVRAQRFRREIAALVRAKKQGLNKVVRIISYGKLHLINKTDKKKYKFYYHITEKADYDLVDCIREGILGNDVSEKKKLCYDLINSLEELHGIGVYHRDIKPENILIFKSGVWKICDLGLVSFRSQDNSIDKSTGIIGAKGWVSPEATNYYYSLDTDEKRESVDYINDKSDVFQLGKIFWFVFQNNIPIGRIKRQDFKLNDDALYSIIVWMIRHDKSKRINLQQLKKEFKY